MKTNAKHLLLCAAAALMTAVLGSCDNRKFRVSGSITDAKDSVLYFENMSLDGPVTVDSVKLDGKGEFSRDHRREGVLPDDGHGLHGGRLA